MKQRLFAGILSLIMIFSLPTTALAADDDVPDAENTASDVAEVDRTRYQDLQEAIDAAKDGDTVTLLDDIAYNSPANIHIAKAVTLNLSGHSITAVVQHETDTSSLPIQFFKWFIHVQEGGALTIQDDTGKGTVTVNGSGGFEIVHAVLVEPNGSFTLNGGTVSSNATTSAKTVCNFGTVTVNGGKLACIGKGSAFEDTYSYGDVHLNGGEIQGAVENSWIGENAYGVYDGNITTVSTTIPEDYARLNSKDRIYYTGVEGANTALADAENGDTLMLRNVIPTGTKKLGSRDTLTVKLEGAAAFDATANLEPETGYKVEGTAGENGTTSYHLVVDESQAAARIGDTYYATISKASDAVNTGETITLLKDVDLASASGGFQDGWAWTVFETYTLDLNGHTLTGNSTSSYADERPAEGAVIRTSAKYGEVTLTIIDSSEEKTGTIRNTASSSYGYALWAGANTLIKVESGNFFGSKSALRTPHGQKYEITGGTFDMDVSNYIGQMYHVEKNVDDAGNITFTIVTPETVKTPVISPNGGRFYGSQAVSITCETDGAAIYYTTDGTEPTVNSTKYIDSFRITGDTTVKAIAVKDGCLPSAVAAAEFTRRTSSNSGSSGSSYAVSAPSAKNGDVTVSPKNASKGDRVTITVTPDKGYELDKLTVKDTSGNKLKLTDKGNGKYTFTMPSSKVTVSAEFVEEQAASIFADVPADAYYAKAVEWAVKKGITNGKANGLFGSNDPCTRGQIVTFLWRAAGSPEPKSMSSFSDVSADSYYAKAVAWAVENGITTGTGDGKFGPDATCTRAQSVTFLFRAIGKLVDSKAEFSDVLTDSYYANAVAWAVENGVTNGIGDGLFGPDNSCTRAQIVTFLFRAYQGK